MGGRRGHARNRGKAEKLGNSPGRRNRHISFNRTAGTVEI